MRLILRRVLKEPTAPAPTITAPSSPYSEGYDFCMACTGVAICPYPGDSKEASQWWDGFMDATEDYIAEDNAYTGS